MITLLSLALAASVVDESLLRHIAWAESRGNPRAIGSHGERGAYQLRACAVADVNLATGWTATVRDMHKPAVGRAYCSAYLHILERRMISAGHQPAARELYQAYRLGFSGWNRKTARQRTSGERIGNRQWRDPLASRHLREWRASRG